MQRRELNGLREDVSERLAVSNDLPNALRFHRLCPARRERTRLDNPEQPRERVVTGRTVLQTNELAQKPLVVGGEFRHVDASRPTHRLESNAIIRISRKSWCVALLVFGSSVPLNN